MVRTRLDVISVRNLPFPHLMSGDWLPRAELPSGYLSGAEIGIKVADMHGA